MHINEIVNKYKNLSCYHGNYLANHLPMVLYSLKYLGIEDEKLDFFANNYIEKTKIVEIKESKVLILEENFHKYLGKRLYYCEYIDFFEKEIERLGIEKVVEKYLEQLAYGISCEAFHPLIRLSFALEYKNSEEVIRSLAYLANSYYSFKVEKLRENFNIDEIAKSLENSKFFKELNHQGNIQDKMIRVKNQSELKDVIYRLPKNIEIEKALELISAMTIELYLKTENFTLLHGVTSCQALKVVLPYIKDKFSLLNSYFIGVQIAYLSTNCVEVSNYQNDIDNLTWEEIKEKVIKEDDSHTIKLVYSSLKEYEKSKDRRYLLSALTKIK